MEIKKLATLRLPQLQVNSGAAKRRLFVLPNKMQVWGKYYLAFRTGGILSLFWHCYGIVLSCFFALLICM